MSGVGVVVGGVVAVGPTALQGVVVPLAFAAAAAASFTAGGNALNDLFDRVSDRVNHPGRPIPAGDVTARRAGAFAGAAFLAAISFGAFAGPWCLAIVASNALLMYAYESDLKEKGARGNVAIAYLVGSLFLFAGFAVYRGDQAALVRSGVLASLAFLTTVGREIVKDIEDMSGDVDRRTLPQRIGPGRAAAVASAAFAAGVAMSALPWALALLGIGYASAVIVADGMFIYAALYSAARPARSQRVAKYAMIVALVAFLAGGLP
jgi:geranylgeranylglycerol-phosphate geranylgeranyltransferase